MPASRNVIVSTEVPVQSEVMNQYAGLTSAKKIAALELDENEAARDGKLADAPDMEGREDLVRERTQDDTPEDKH